MSGNPEHNRNEAMHMSGNPEHNRIEAMHMSIFKASFSLHSFPTPP